ncbi:MAG: hypothetical protein J1F18_08125 [Lachnospiraceae bacterium]|nr:hypothetical protein [Lachnospiraceae bacterium]
MRQQWMAVLFGLVTGILIVLVGNVLINTNNEKQQQDEEAQSIGKEIQLETAFALEQENVPREDSSILGQEKAHQETFDNVRISTNMQIPLQFAEQMLLYEYIEYGLRKYNEANGQEIRYSCSIEEDMLPFDTEFCMINTDEEPFRIDLAKEIIPELANNIYNFELKNQNNTIWMSIDTYNMKIFVYDSIIK